ncbi:hypothetical protein B5S31_g4214 [[Candida] boidinii]|nr:hypothetical protein B5S31_g4214 [[Candida] boidinii]
MNTHKPLDKKRVDIKPRLLSCRFNQNQSCFAIGLETGFKVYNTDPMNVRTTKIFANASAFSDSSVTDDSTDGNKSIYTGSGIGLITMLNRTNYLALVGGGCNPKYPMNKVIIWDDLKKKESITLEFTSNVLNVMISRLRIIVVLRNHVLIYSFESRPKLITKYETYDNDLGCAYLSSGTIAPSQSATQSLSSSGSSTAGAATAPSSLSSSGSDHHILAFPGRTIGQIQIIDMSPSKIDKNVVSIVKSHKNKITNICVSHGGHMIASASEIGTLIRVHSSLSGSLLFEFRRGADRANITSMEFSPNDSKLAVISDKNTLHVFNISDTINGNSMKDNINNDNGGKRRSSGGSGGSGDSDQLNQLKEFRNKSHFLKNWNIFPSYYNSTWSFVSKHISDETDSELLGNSRSGKNGGENTKSGSSGTSTSNNASNYTRSSSGLSPNVSGSSGIDIKNTKNEDTGILGWSDEYSIIVIWKLKCKWEKYVIVEKEYIRHGGNHNTNSLDNDDHSEGQYGKKRKWELVREGWRSFGNLNS